MRVSKVAWGAAFVAATWLATGCGRTWPRVRGVGDADFLAAGGVRTIDVLPLDLSVTTSRETPEPPEIIAERFELVAAGEVESQLVRRGYQVAAFIAPDGSFQRGDEHLQAMEPEAIEQTQVSLAAYGGAQARTREVLLTPYLPSRLGSHTGADATLYVGGWGYAGRDDHGVSAGDVAKVVVIALFIVVVIAVVAAVAKKGGGGGGGKGGGGGAVQAGGGGFARAAGNATGAVARGSAGAVRGVGRAGYHVMRGFSRTADAWGRSHTHIEIWAGNPTPTLPESGASRTFLEMTLVDNQRGLVLWHARQEFPANPGKPDDVRQAVARLMGGLPEAR